MLLFCSDHDHEAVADVSDMDDSFNPFKTPKPNGNQQQQHSVSLGEDVFTSGNNQKGKLPTAILFQAV